MRPAPISYLLTLSLLILVSCAGDEGDTVVNESPQQQEETGGTTTGGTSGGTTTGGGSSGGSGGHNGGHDGGGSGGHDGGGHDSCSTTSQRENIRMTFDRAAKLSEIFGEGSGSFKRDGSGHIETSDDFSGSYVVTILDDNSWDINGAFCEGWWDDCEFHSHDHGAFDGKGCFFWNGNKVKIKSTSSSSVSFSYIDPAGISTNVKWSVPKDDDVTFNQDWVQKNKKYYWKFESDNHDGDHGGDHGGGHEGGDHGGDDGGGDYGGDHGGDDGGGWVGETAGGVTGGM